MLTLNRLHMLFGCLGWLAVFCQNECFLSLKSGCRSSVVEKSADYVKVNSEGNRSTLFAVGLFGFIILKVTFFC